MTRRMNAQHADTTSAVGLATKKEWQMKTIRDIVLFPVWFLLAGILWLIAKIPSKLYN